MQNLFDDEIWDVADVVDVSDAEGREHRNSIISDASDNGNDDGIDDSGGSKEHQQPNGINGHHDDKAKVQ